MDGASDQTLFQSDTLPNSIKEECAPEIFSVPIDRLNLLVVKGVVRLRLEDCGEPLPLMHDFKIFTN